MFLNAVFTIINIIVYQNALLSQSNIALRDSRNLEFKLHPADDWPRASLSSLNLGCITFLASLVPTHVSFKCYVFLESEGNEMSFKSPDNHHTPKKIVTSEISNTPLDIPKRKTRTLYIMT